MKRFVYTSLIALIAVALQFAPRLLRAEDITINKDTKVTPTAVSKTMEEIVVSARRTTEAASEVPYNISVITSKELSQMPVNNLADALNLVAGVDVQTAGPLGQSSTVSIQGCNPGQVRVMVDGVLLNAQSTAFVNPSQIPIEDVARIEVIKGPGSSAWGSALGGVVNVITKIPDATKPFQGSLALSGGSGAYGFGQEALNLFGKSNDLKYTVTGINLDSGQQFKPYGDVKSRQADAKVSYLLSETSNLEASYHYNTADVGAFRMTDIDFGEDLFYNTSYGSLKYTATPNLEIWKLGNLEIFEATAKVASQYGRISDYTLSTHDPVDLSSSTDLFAGLDLQSKLQVDDKQNILVGADLGQDEIKVKGDYFGAFNQEVPRQNLQRQGYYANYNLLLGAAWSIEAGARYDNNDAYGNQFSPSGGVVYHLPLWHTDIRVSAARGFNAPPLIYKYIVGNPYLLPNPDLKAELAPISYAAGIETKPESDLTCQVSVYRAELNHFVDFEDVSPGVSMAVNIDRVRRQGFDAGVKYDFLSNWQAEVGGAYNRVVNRDTDQIIQGGGVARMSYNVGVNYHYDRINVSVKGNYRFWNAAPDPSTGLRPKDRVFIWDGRFNYSLTKDKNDSNAPLVFLAINNALNAKYSYDPNLPLPGRVVEAGIKYPF